MQGSFRVASNILFPWTVQQIIISGSQILQTTLNSIKYVICKSPTEICNKNIQSPFNDKKKNSTFFKKVNNILSFMTCH